MLEDFLEKFDKENRGKENLAYLPYTTLAALALPTKPLAKEFVEVYGGKAKGNYKHLRTIFPSGDDSKSWDIVRNRELKLIKETVATKNIKLFKDDGVTPTDEHLEMIYWAYSPQPDKIKTFITKSDKNNSNSSKKRPAKSSSDESDDDNMDDDDDDDSGRDASPSSKKKSRRN